MSTNSIICRLEYNQIIRYFKEISMFLWIEYNFLYTHGLEKKKEYELENKTCEKDLQKNYLYLHFLTVRRKFSKKCKYLDLEQQNTIQRDNKRD